MAELNELREWAEGIVGVLPARHEATRRALAALFLLDWAPDANEVLIALRPYIVDIDAITERVDELLTRWAREVQ